MESVSAKDSCRQVAVFVARVNRHLKWPKDCPRVSEMQSGRTEIEIAVSQNFRLCSCHAPRGHRHLSPPLSSNSGEPCVSQGGRLKINLKQLGVSIDQKCIQLAVFETINECSFLGIFLTCQRLCNIVRCILYGILRNNEVNYSDLLCQVFRDHSSKDLLRAVQRIGSFQRLLQSK